MLTLKNTLFRGYKNPLKLFLGAFRIFKSQGEKIVRTH